MIKNIVIFIFISVILSTSAYAQRKYIFTWDEGSGTAMPGWTYYGNGNLEIVSGHPGWVNETAWEVINSQGGPGPRSFEKSDYGNDSRPEIITTDKAPSTFSGGSLRIYDTGDVSTYQSCWWQWYDGVGLGMSPRTVSYSDTDRFSYYIKLNTSEEPDGTSIPGTYFHVGTYLCDNGPSGEGCPHEGPGNTHFYFYLTYKPGIWIHTLLDRHPTHLRESFVAGDDPAFIMPPHDTQGAPYPMHFYEHLHQFYMEVIHNQNSMSSYILDEMYFYSTKDAFEEAEPNQNDVSVTSLWIGYDPSTGYWYTGWQDESYENENGENLNDNTNSTFEIRWSNSPITNANYNNANVVSPEWFSGPEHTSYPNGIRRQDPWRVRIWTRFNLPAGVEDNNNHLYFAVKDVSKADGSTAGDSWPYTLTDGHDAASPYIKTIDYYIRPDDSGTCSDGIQNGDETGIDCGGSCPPCATVISCGTSPMIQ